MFTSIHSTLKQWLRNLQGLRRHSWAFKKPPYRLEAPLGPAGEQEAVKYLKKNSFLIWELNWRCPYGELDIVASRGQTLVFIEVKTRRLRNDHLFEPFEALDDIKQNRLRQLSKWFVSSNRDRIRKARIKAFRFDAIAVYKENNCWRIVHEKDAFR